MESGNSFRSRKQALKPIETRKSEDDVVSKNNGKSTCEEEPLSPSSRLYHEPHFNVYVIAVMGCKTKIYPDVVKANLGHTLLRHPRFSSLQVEDEKNGEMRWVPTEVDLERHVIVPELDQNMDSPDKFLEDYIHNLSKTTIEKSKPLWDLHLLNLKNSQSEAVGIFRIHHSLGDGTSLLSLLLACTRKTNDPQALPTIPIRKKQEKKNIDRSGFSRIMSRLWFHIQVFWNTVVDVFMFLATALFLTDSPNPLKGLPGSESTPRRIVYRTVSLNDMKFVKNAMNNTTINDVAFGMTQAGLSRYINRICGEKKKDGEATGTNNLPKSIRLRSTLLVNIRPSPGIQGLADMMEKDAEVKWGNWIGYVLLPFKIAMKENPLDYVRDAKAIIDRKKRSLEAITTFHIADIALKFFGIKAAGAFSHNVVSRTTMCFSNMVGPVEEIGFCGHPMAFLAPSSYGQPYALMINFQSYIDKMTIVLSVDEGTIPNPHQLCDDIVESLRVIKEAAMTGGLA